MLWLRKEESKVVERGLARVFYSGISESLIILQVNKCMAGSG